MRGEVLNQIAEVLRRPDLPVRVLGAVVFGSTARGEVTPDSDVDLLVVAEGLPPQRHRRGREISLLRRLFPGVLLDVYLVTPQEALANFRNHNPLFLDIAVEGIVLLDSEGFLQGLMEETRAYVRERGVQRIPGGWQFPVQRGAPTPLSRLTNRDFAQGMLRDGERDFQIGQRLVGDGFFDKAIYHFQQATEKAVKAILIATGTFQKTHFVASILTKRAQEVELPDVWRARLLDVASLAERLEPEMAMTRYPAILDDRLWLPWEEYDREDALEAERTAAVALETAREFLDFWFGVSDD